MANWLHGYMSITGSVDDVNAVVKELFHRNSDSFFVGVLPESTEDEAQKMISRYENGTVEVSYPAKYHTSIYSCFLTDACWDDDGNYYGTLSDLCRNNNVSIAAEGTEYLGGFSESMKCNTRGEIAYEIRETDIAECPACGEQQLVDRGIDMSALSCPRCSKKGLRSWRDV